VRSEELILDLCSEEVMPEVVWHEGRRRSSMWGLFRLGERRKRQDTRKGKQQSTKSSKSRTQQEQKQQEQPSRSSKQYDNPIWQQPESLMPSPVSSVMPSPRPLVMPSLVMPPPVVEERKSRGFLGQLSPRSKGNLLAKLSPRSRSAALQEGGGGWFSTVSILISTLNAHSTSTSRSLGDYLAITQRSL